MYSTYSFATTLLTTFLARHKDICQWLASDVLIQVTDLHILDRFGRVDQASCASLASPCSYGFLEAVVPSIRRLSLALRLPLPFFQALESDTPASGALQQTRSQANEEALASRWVRVWPSLAVRLEKLQSLHVWLDHTDSRSWCLVNERKVLSVLAESMSPRNIPTLREVSVSLPNLHPRHENPEYHFTQNSPGPAACITISRRLRQRYYYEEKSSGHGTVTYVPDFPLLLEFHEMEGLGSGPTTREEIEDFERTLWERGDDVEQLIWEAVGPGGGFLNFGP